MQFPRQEYWSGLEFPSPGDLPDPRIEPGPPSLQVDSLTLHPGVAMTHKDEHCMASFLYKNPEEANPPK